MAVTIFRDVTDAKRAEDMTRFLAAVNLELSRSLHSTAIARTLADLAVPTLADWCVVDLLEVAEPKRVAVASTSRVGDPLAAYASALPDAKRLLAKRAPVLVTTMTDADLVDFARDPGHLQALTSIRLCSMIAVPLVAHDRVLGEITFATAESRRHYSQAELAIARDLATRAALALDNARLYSESQQQTETHVQLNAALRNAMEQLEQALATRDEFLAAASHDLKNPIASIKAMSQLLQRRLTRTGHVSEEQLRETLSRIDAVATRASAQVEELLDLTSMRLDRPLNLDRHAMDLVRLANEVVGEQQQATESRTISLDADVPELVGHWDARRLARAVSNILDNAIKYSPDDSPIQVRLITDGEWAMLSVEDHGMGIPPEDLQSIFARFQRGRNVIGRVSGTGIGLASAQHIVQSHGGSIEATSQLGVGTTITLRLPLERPQGPSAE